MPEPTNDEIRAGLAAVLAKVRANEAATTEAAALHALCVARTTWSEAADIRLRSQCAGVLAAQGQPL